MATKQDFRKIKNYKVDLIFNALHGRDGEDGIAQSYFEYFKIPYTHSGILSSMNAMDKIISKKIFKNSFGITIQGGYCFYKKFIVYTNYRWTKRNSPAIQKQSNNTSGIQLGIAYKLWDSRKKL